MHQIGSHYFGKFFSTKEDIYKYGGIIFLTVQQASMPLMVRSTRYRKENDVFITTVNVFIMEIIKLVVCSAILIGKEKSITKFIESLRSAICDNFGETLKICIPAIIYILQNNLYYIALTNLEATTFCVTYQMKILTTALLLKVVLHKKLSNPQWIALVLLIVGVSDVQLQYQPPQPVSGYLEQKPWLGFAAVITMCFTSAFAGVYMELILKKSTENVAMQNIRLALFGLIVAGGSMLYKDYNTIKEDGFLRGFDSLVWIMTFTNSIGGLLIAVVIKYSDNIMKGYAQSTAIVGAAIGSWVFFDFIPNGLFLFGTFLVIASIVIYTKNPYQESEADKNYILLNNEEKKINKV